MSRNNRLNRIVKTCLKAALTWHFPSGKPPIFLVATPRGGSTWVSEVICSEPRVRYVAEPLNIRSYGVSEALVVKHWEDMWDIESADLIEYFECLVSGRIRMRDATPFRHLGRYGFRFRTDRTLLKVIHGATYHLAAIQEYFSAKIVVIIRHPIATAVSREVFPAMERIMYSHFFQGLKLEQQECVQRVLESGSHVEKGVLAWCLHNSPILQLKEKSVLVLTYEELTLCPEAAIRKLCEYCDLSASDALLQTLGSASVTVRKSDDATKQLLRQENTVDRRRQLVQKWRGKVCDEDVVAAQEVLDCFKIQLYSASDFLPSSDWLIDSESVNSAISE